MKAARISRYGAVDVISVVADADRPILAEGQLLIELRASSRNPIDTVLREGRMHAMAPLQLSATVGGDFAGVLAETRPGVTNFAHDDEVVVAVAEARAG